MSSESLLDLNSIPDFRSSTALACTGTSFFSIDTSFCCSATTEKQGEGVFGEWSDECEKEASIIPGHEGRSNRGRGILQFADAGNDTRGRATKGVNAGRHCNENRGLSKRLAATAGGVKKCSLRGGVAVFLSLAGIRSFLAGTTNDTLDFLGTVAFGASGNDTRLEVADAMANETLKGGFTGLALFAGLLVVIFGFTDSSRLNERRAGGRATGEGDMTTVLRATTGLCVDARIDGGAEVCTLRTFCTSTSGRNLEAGGIGSAGEAAPLGALLLETTLGVAFEVLDRTIDLLLVDMSMQ